MTHISNVRNIPRADILVKRRAREHTAHISNVRNIPRADILIKR